MAFASEANFTGLREKSVLPPALTVVCDPMPRGEQYLLPYRPFENGGRQGERRANMTAATKTISAHGITEGAANRSLSLLKLDATAAPDSNRRGSFQRSGVAVDNCPHVAGAKRTRAQSDACAAQRFRRRLTWPSGHVWFVNS